MSENMSSKKYQKYFERALRKTFYEKSPHKFAQLREQRQLWSGCFLRYVTRSKNQHQPLFAQQFGTNKGLFVNNLSKIMSKLQRQKGCWLPGCPAAWPHGLRLTPPLRPGRCRWLAFKHFITAIAPLKPSSQCEELKFHASWAHKKELPASSVWS